MTTRALKSSVVRISADNFSGPDEAINRYDVCVCVCVCECVQTVTYELNKLWHADTM